MARRFAERQPTPVQEADSAAFAMYADISEIVAGGTPHSQLPRAHAATPVVHPSFFQEYADITVDVARRKKLSPIVAGSLSSSYDLSPPVQHVAHAAPSDGVNLFKTVRSPVKKTSFIDSTDFLTEADAGRRSDETARILVTADAINENVVENFNKRQTILTRSAKTGHYQQHEIPLTADKDVLVPGITVRTSQTITDNIPLVSNQDIFVNRDAAITRVGMQPEERQADDEVPLISNEDVFVNRDAAITRVGMQPEERQADDEVPLISNEDVFVNRDAAITRVGMQPEERQADDEVPLISNEDVFVNRDAAITRVGMQPEERQADDEVPLISNEDVFVNRDAAITRVGMQPEERQADDEVPLISDRKEAEEAKSKEEERRRKKVVEEANRKEEEEERQRKEAEETKRREEEERQRKEAGEAKRKQEEERQRKEAEEAKRKEDEEMQRKEAEETKRKEEGERQRMEAEEAKRMQEEERQRKEAEETKRKAEEERQRKEAEETKRKAEEERQRKEADEAKRKEEEERQRKEAEETKRKDEEVRQRKEAEEVKGKEEEESPLVLKMKKAQESERKLAEQAGGAQDRTGEQSTEQNALALAKERVDGVLEMARLEEIKKVQERERKLAEQAAWQEEAARMSKEAEERDRMEAEKRRQMRAAETERAEAEARRRAQAERATLLEKARAVARQAEFERKLADDMEREAEENSKQRSARAIAQQKALAAKRLAEQDQEIKEELLRAKERTLHRKRAETMKGQEERYIKAEMHRAQEEERISAESKARAVHAQRAAVLEQFERAECSSLAETGITVKVERRGAVITGFRPGSSAAASEFKQGDIIAQIGEEIVSGLSAFEILVRLRGEKGSEVEIVASRVTNNAKVRISDLVERDVSLPPMQAEPGISLKVALSGASVTKVYEATSADGEGLEVGDVLIVVDGEFVAGMALNDIAEKLRGLAGTRIDIAIMRTKDRVKSRLEFEIVRDHNLTPIPVRSIFDRATVGITTKAHAHGLKVTAILKGTDADGSDLVPGDVITIVGDAILVGLPLHLAEEQLAGPRGSTVELISFRTSMSGKQRISSVLVRDVDLPPAEAVPGVEVKHDASGGLLVSKVHEHTSADVEGLKVGDVISQIGDEFVCGMPLKEAMDLLSGKASSSVELTLSRVEARMKTRLCFTVIRDFGHKDLDLAKEARKRDNRAQHLSERKKIQADAQAAHDRLMEERRVRDDLRKEGVLQSEIMTAVVFKKTNAKAQRSSALLPPTGPKSSFEALTSDPGQESCAIVGAEPSAPEEALRKKKTYTIWTERAEVGIRYCANERGLLVEGFVKGTSASKSELMPKDVIIQVGEHFLAGMPTLEAFGLMSGDMHSEVQLTVARQVEGARTRLVIPVERDVPGVPQRADLGISYKQEASGVRVSKVFSGTSACDELQKNDVITQIDDEFIAGMPMAEVKELLSGPAQSKIQIVFSRFDADSNIKKRCMAEVMFDCNARAADLGEYSKSGDVGIECKRHILGLLISGFKKGTSASSSPLQVGDIITQVDDELIIGMPLNVALSKMTGPRDTHIQIVACRASANGAKTRVSAWILRDVGSMPKLARPGLEVEMDPGGLRIIDIVAGTEAAACGLHSDDTIVMIDDEFIAGFSVQDAWSRLWGEVSSSVSICACRHGNGVKERITTSVIRDYHVSVLMPRQPPSMLMTKLAKLPTQASASFKPVFGQTTKKSKRVEAKGSGGGFLIIAVFVAIIACIVYKCADMEECTASAQIVAQVVQDSYHSVKDNPHVEKALQYIGHGYKTVAAASIRAAPVITDKAKLIFQAVTDTGARAVPVVADRAKEVCKVFADAGGRAGPEMAGRVSTFISGAKNSSYVAVAVQAIEETYKTVRSRLPGGGGDPAAEQNPSPKVLGTSDNNAQSAVDNSNKGASVSLLHVVSMQADRALSAINRGVSSLFRSGLKRDLPTKPSDAASAPGQEGSTSSATKSASKQAGQARTTLMSSLVWSRAGSHQEGPVKVQESARSVVDDVLQRIEEARKAMLGSPGSSASSSEL